MTTRPSGDPHDVPGLPPTPTNAGTGRQQGAASRWRRSTAEGAPRARQVTAWALWDWGSAAFNAVVTTFVFTVWLTSTAFVPAGIADAAEAEGTDGGPATRELSAVLAEHSEWLGWGLTVAGLLIAILAPVAGSRSDDAGRRKRWLGIHTTLVVLVCAAMFLVEPDPDSLTSNLWLGIVLLSVGNVFFELAAVNYNAMLRQVSTPRTLGRISGIGWGAGYIGGIVLLLILFAGFIQPDVGWFGVTSEDGMNIRVSVLLSAVWFAVFAIPVMLAVPEVPKSPDYRRRSVAASYRQLWQDVRELWRTAPQTLRFMVAAAVYRDGLSGVFVFGAVIAGGTFGFEADEIILFAIAANVVAGLSTIVAGFLDDLVGPRALIVTSLSGMLVAGLVLFFLHDSGKTAFWIFGLALCLFVGPAQSASRSLLAGLIPAGRESEIFGLYATTGRAAAFMAPFAFSTFVAVSGSQHWGILGIMLVIAVGLALLWPLPVGRRDRGVPPVPLGPAGSALVP